MQPAKKDTPAVAGDAPAKSPPERQVSASDVRLEEPSTAAAAPAAAPAALAGASSDSAVAPAAVAAGAATGFVSLTIESLWSLLRPQPAASADADAESAAVEPPARAGAAGSAHAAAGVTPAALAPLTPPVSPARSVAARVPSKNTSRIITPRNKWRSIGLCVCVWAALAVAVVVVVVILNRDALFPSQARNQSAPRPVAGPATVPRNVTNDLTAADVLPDRSAGVDALPAWPSMPPLPPKPPPPSPSPPPSPPPVMSLSLGGRVAFTVAGDVVSFDRALFVDQLAEALRVARSSLAVHSVAAGSVVARVLLSSSLAPAGALVNLLLRGELTVAQLQVRFPAGSPFLIERIDLGEWPSELPPAPPPSPPPPRGWLPSIPLPNISFPNATLPPSLPNVSLPNATLPSVPSFPNSTWPSLPNISLPNVTWPPSLPNISLPNGTWPSLPNISLPNGTWPSLPNISLPNGTWPSLPNISWPNGTWPSLPNISWPSWPPSWPSLPSLPFIPAVPDGVLVPPNLIVSAAVEALWINWLQLFLQRNRTHFPGSSELLDREPFAPCALPAATSVAARATQLIQAARGAAQAAPYAIGLSAMWTDTVKVVSGATNPAALQRAALVRATQALANRSADALDALPLVATLLLAAADSTALGAELVGALRAAALNYSYWLDEFGDANNRGNGSASDAPLTPCGRWTAADRGAALSRGDLEQLTYWSDDEAIVLHTAQHLLGAALSGGNAVFVASCRTGDEQRALGGARARRWLDLRLAPAMGLAAPDSDRTLGRIVSALAALAAHSPDAELALRARMALDVLLHEVGVHSYRGTLPMNRGQRTGGLGGYSLSSNLVWLLTGQGTCLLGEPASSSLALALLAGGYSVPRVLEQAAAVLEPAGPIAEEDDDIIVGTRTASDVSVAAALALGLSYGANATVADCEYWLSLGGAAAPVAVECPFVLARAYGDKRGPLRAYRYLKPLANITLPTAPDLGLGWLTSLVGGGGAASAAASAPQKSTLLAGAVRLVSPVARGLVKGAASTYDFRYKGVLLSSLLDYQPGALAVGGRHPQTISLDPAAGAVIFTSAPPRPAFESSAHEWWSVQATMPRVAQWREMAITIYNPPVEASALLPFVLGTAPPQMTHAHFNKSAFDEYVEVVGRDGVAKWHCARKGSGYVALYSYQPAAFATEGPYAGVDLQADGSRNVWVSHVGDASLDGSFATWTNQIRKGWMRVDILPPGPDRDGGLPWCLWQNECVVGFPDKIDYWRLVKCVQWIPFINTRPVCGHTLDTMGFVRGYLSCDLPDWRLCLAFAAIKAIDWSLPSATFGHVDVEYVPYLKSALQFSWDKELLVGRRYNAVRREPFAQKLDRFDTPFSSSKPWRNATVLGIRAGALSAHLDFGATPPTRALVDQ